MRQNLRKKRKLHRRQVTCKCGYVARDQSRLANHTKRERPCDECKNSFLCYNALKNHLLKDHIKNQLQAETNKLDCIEISRNDFVCECGYRSGSLTELSRHRRKLRNCDLCDETFRCKTSLRQHKANAHVGNASKFQKTEQNVDDLYALDYSVQKVDRDKPQQGVINSTKIYKSSNTSNSKIFDKMEEINQILQIINKLVE